MHGESTDRRPLTGREREISLGIKNHFEEFSTPASLAEMANRHGAAQTRPQRGTATSRDAGKGATGRRPTAPARADLFCGPTVAEAVTGTLCSRRHSSQPENTARYEIDIEWDKSLDPFNRPGTSGLPVHTKSAVVSQAAVNNASMRVGDTWYWDKTVNGISRLEERPLLATVHFRKVGTKYNLGTTTSLQFAVNPQIAIGSPPTATEGTDTHLEFLVSLYPPALETVTVDYATSDITATAGSDYTATSGTLTFAVGEDAKLIRVPITDDGIPDSGELVNLTISNPSGATRLLFTTGVETPVFVTELGPVNTYLSASKMSTKWMKPMNITSSFSNRENIRR